MLAVWVANLNRYRRVMDASGENVGMVQLAIVQDLRRAGFGVGGDSPELTCGRSGVLVITNDGRRVCRDAQGRWMILPGHAKRHVSEMPDSDGT